MPRPPSAANERITAVHALSEKVTVVLVASTALLDALAAIAKSEESTEGIRELVGAAVAIAADMDRAAREAIPLFERLRKVL